MSETDKYIKRKEDRAIKVFSQALEDFNRTGNILITQDEFREYTPILLNIIQKQKKEYKNEADKLFDKLGYKLEYEDKDSFLLFNKKERRFITFLKSTKTLLLSSSVTMQELQAIYLKCKELGWIE